ncbi:putative amidoligase domain-containing protein [Cohnella panacarvi]|uniref:putative amidoligase domain-containing protein n=1 Tax=Cohnella panacarvi TaxID=400776 RepID=UPI00047E51CE|nr:hypothetical protein [Cohnella panacarvi]
MGEQAAQAGQVWLDRGGVAASRWMALSGIPVLQAESRARDNDCVLLTSVSPSLREGAREGQFSSLSPWLMNGSAGQHAIIPRAEIERRLQREGLSARMDGDADYGRGYGGRRFSVSLFDLSVIEVRRIVHHTSYITDGKRGTSVDERLRNIISKAAVRALYVQGLDFGEVDLELDDWGRATILDVRAVYLRLSAEGEADLAAAVSEFASVWAFETGQGVRVMLGADPEFVMLRPDGAIVPASRYLPRDGDAGCDSVVIRGVRRWPLAELRPAPAAEPAAVAADVRRLLNVASRRTAGAALSWRAGAVPVRGLPLGGHVHISGAALTGERLRALDNAVALPLRLLEPPSAASRRPRFGALGDFRRQSHGGFEYRTPPSWLVSPRLACGVLALVKVAAEHARDLAASRPLDDDAVRDAFYAGDRDVLLSGAAAVRESLANTSGYGKYEKYIGPLFQAIDQGRTWNEATDLRERWGIPVR